MGSFGAFGLPGENDGCPGVRPVFAPRSRMTVAVRVNDRL